MVSGSRRQENPDQEARIDPFAPFAGPQARFEAAGIRCRRGERVLFEGLSFALAGGDALLLLGANGTGKTSLLRLLAGLLGPLDAQDGALSWRGRSVWDDPEAYHREVHFLGHADGIKAALSVAENLSFWAGLHNRRKPDLDGALGVLDLAGFGDMPARFLSAGQRRRLALARLCAAPAPLWLLDEPTAGLDAASIARLEALIASHRAAGGLVVASSHAALKLEPAARIDLGSLARGTTTPFRMTPS